MLASSSVFADWEHDLHLEFGGYLNGDSRAVIAHSRENAALALESRYTHESESGIQFTLVPFVRLDASDDTRNHIDLREAQLLKAFNSGWVIQAGLSKEFWGVAESQHLEDIINQTDALEGFSSEEKLGQPMLKVTREYAQSRVDAYLLPYFREREFLSAANRQSAPVPLSGASRFESADKQRHIDYALRWRGYQGSVDYGLSWFRGTSREPRFIANNSKASAGDAAAPLFDTFYPQLTQWGLSLQYTGESALLKLEAVEREVMDEVSHAATGGLEYTLYGLAEGMIDLGLLAELHRDSRDDRARILFQNDLFLGVRLGVNDTHGSSLLAGALIDQDDNSTSFRLEGERRLTDQLKLAIEAIGFSQVDQGNALSGSKDNAEIRLTLHRYF